MQRSVSGTSVSASVRRSRHGSHTAKRPHMRRGHWHHFWTGPMDSAQDRKLVLKWLPPIFVGSSQDGEMPVTLHKVKL